MKKRLAVLVALLTLGVLASPAAAAIHCNQCTNTNCDSECWACLGPLNPDGTCPSANTYWFYCGDFIRYCFSAATADESAEAAFWAAMAAPVPAAAPAVAGN